MDESATIIIVLLTFLLAGTVKGVIGLGLPTISLALITVAIDLPTAMGVLLIPSFVTNLWQAFVGGNGKVLLRRIWPFLLTATTMIWIGALALTRVDVSLLSALLGLLLIGYAILSLAGKHFNLTIQQEAWAGPLTGTVNGLLTGMTGSFVVPGVLFLQAIGLSRDQLIQSMGILFTASTLALAVALKSNNLLTIELGMISGVAVLPALLGMILGQQIRKNLSEKIFRRIFFVALLLLGTYIIVSALQHVL